MACGHSLFGGNNGKEIVQFKLCKNNPGTYE